jgi:uncharacterized membrane protein
MPDTSGSRLERNARSAALGSLIALTGILVLWHVSRYSAATAALALAVTLGPLVLPLYGLLARARRACVLGTLVVAPYLAYSIMEALANPGARSFAIATLGAASLLLSVPAPAPARAADCPNPCGS